VVAAVCPGQGFRGRLRQRSSSAESILASDIEYLADFIDAADKIELRAAPDGRSS
jgi:hypothetical protein